MKKAVAIAISFAAGAIALVLVLTQVNIQHIMLTLKSVDVPILALYLAIIGTIMIVLTWRWHIIIKSQGHPKISFWHLFWYKIIGYGISNVTPSAKMGGEPVRAGLLARKGMSFKSALSTVVIDKTIELTSSGIFFVIGALVILSSFALTDRTRWMMIVVSVFFVMGIVYFYMQMLNGKDFFGKLFRVLGFHKTKWGKAWSTKLKEFEKLVIRFYHKDKKYFLAVMLVSLLSWALMFLEFMTLLLAFGQPSEITHIFLIFSFVGAAFLTPIPMALGALEASMIWVFAIIKYSPALAVAIALIIRLKDLLWTILGFIALSIYGLKFNQAVLESDHVSKTVSEIEDET